MIQNFITGNAINFFESSQWSAQFIVVFVIASLILLFVNPFLLWLATKILKDGMVVEVNANHGVVKILK